MLLNVMKKSYRGVECDASMDGDDSVMVVHVHMGVHATCSHIKMVKYVEPSQKMDQLKHKSLSTLPQIMDMRGPRR